MIEKVSVERLRRRIDELGAVGRVGRTGVTRLGLSVEEERARDLVASWLSARGAQIRRDEAANLFARVGPAGDPIVVGSHLDSVPSGGRFDGALGVLCAVEAAEALSDAGVESPPLEVVGWTDEEGARFGVGLFGSAAAYGRLPAGVERRADRDGVTIEAALRALGFSGAPVGARRGGRDRAYLELHIEQGPHLERDGHPLGVVTSIVGITHARVTVRGVAGHAGTTPMAGRHDALAAASELVLALEEAARSHVPAVGTVGEIAVSPGAKNVVPGECSFTIDARAPDDRTRRAVLAEFGKRVRTVERSRGVQIEMDTLSDIPAVAMDGTLRRALADALGQLGLPAPELPSGAGHDSQNAALAGVPSAMLFIRSRNGSHNPAEDASPEDAALAVKALLLSLDEISR